MKFSFICFEYFLKKKHFKQPRNTEKVCKEYLSDYSKDYNKRARTMERRLTRITNWITFLGRRIRKKDEFIASQKLLLSALGGNKSAPSCNGKTNTKYSGNY